MRNKVYQVSLSFQLPVQQLAKLDKFVSVERNIRDRSDAVRFAIDRFLVNRKADITPQEIHDKLMLGYAKGLLKDENNAVR